MTELPEIAVPTAPYRFIAQDISSGEILNWNMPLTNVTVTYSLSGPCEIAGDLTPEMPHLNLEAYEEWATWLHLEQDGHIRASGILQPLSFDGPKAEVAAVGFTDYAHGIPFLGERKGIQVDPLDEARAIWAHLQSYSEALHGVTLADTTSPIKIGEEERDVEFETGDGEEVAFTAGPYKLVWWEAKDCGQEFDNLAKETPFDYRESVRWNAAKTNVLHHIELGYPRLGRKREDLRFAYGENISKPVPYAKNDTWVSEVHVLGSGEGRKRIHGVASEPTSKIRRVAVIEDKDIDSKRRAQRVALDELRRRQAYVSFEEITVDISHPNAAWGTYSTGDDIKVTGKFPWLGVQTIWHRVVKIEVDLRTDKAKLSLIPSDSVYYGPPLTGA